MVWCSLECSLCADGPNQNSAAEGIIAGQFLDPEVHVIYGYFLSECGTFEYFSSYSSSSSSSGHEVRPINDLFRPHDCIPPVGCLTAVQIFVFRQIDSEGIF
jgi:hypothetical protein